MIRKSAILCVSAVAVLIGATPAFAQLGCDGLPSHAQLKTALKNVQKVSDNNGGFGFHMWATVVNRDGEVCAVVFSGSNRWDQWPGSRVISAQKANTANAFSLDGFALATGNLWAATQPGGSLFGLQHSNPIETAVGYGQKPKTKKAFDASRYGQSDDPMVGFMPGGVNVFGGGVDSIRAVTR